MRTLAGVFLLGSVAQSLAAQTRSLDAFYGVWRSDAVATVWAAGITRELMAPVEYGISLTHLDDRRSLLDRTQTGGELSLGIGRDGSGPYVLGAGGLAMKHSDGNLDAFWSAGGGFRARLLPFLTLGIEARYRVEDQASRGFWQLDSTDRRGVLVLASASILLGSARGRGPNRGHVASSGTLERDARRKGLTRGDLAAAIVGTAVQAMGTPYQWGGDGANGYDCSGLIQFAYAEHGISLPRVSREQAVVGVAVSRDIQDLAPGDILGFSLEGDRITHVGLYVGDGQFIHSASSGVRVSSLTADDPDSLWWRRRWTVARRILE